MAIGPAGVDLTPSYRVPDLIVVSRRLLGEHRKSVRPADVSVAVEVVSPGSRSMDRIMNPAQYAAAGIGSYWCVETEPEISLPAYVLEPGEHVYAEVGTWGTGQTARLDRPFPLEIAIDTLIPSVAQ